MAAFAAVGYAKFSGRVGVCMATSGPGAIHLLNGLYDAKLDHVPVVAIVGQTARSAMGGSYQQEVDLQSLFKDVAADYLRRGQRPRAAAQRLSTARSAPPWPERAPTASSSRATCRRRTTTPPEHAFKQCRRVHRRTMPTAVPPHADIERAAECSTPAQKVAMLVGQGARDAADEVIEVAELTGAGVAKALLGKDVLPDDLPFVTGSIGLLGTRPSYELMRDCDTLLIVGSNFPYSSSCRSSARPARCRSTSTARLIGMRYPTEVNLVGDAQATLRALIPLLRRKDRPLLARDRREERRALVADHRTPGHAGRRSGQPDAGGAGSCRSGCPDDAIVTADSGSVDQLVRPRPADPRPDAGFAFGHPGHHGPGGAVCDRREIRPSRTGR